MKSRYAASLLVMIALFLTCCELTSQEDTTKYNRVYVGTDGLAHVVDASGHDVTIPAEVDQTSVSSLQISPDRRSAGWLVNEDSCCQSYSIPLRLVLYAGKTKHVIQDVQMIYEWSFVKSGRNVAISKGTTHGQNYTDLVLFDTDTEKPVAKWDNDGEPNATRPSWAPHPGK